MKYQYILNDIVQFETDNAHEFMIWVLENQKYYVNTLLYNLLDKAGNYKWEQVTASDT